MSTRELHITRSRWLGLAGESPAGERDYHKTRVDPLPLQEVMISNELQNSAASGESGTSAVRVTVAAPVLLTLTE